MARRRLKLPGIAVESEPQLVVSRIHELIRRGKKSAIEAFAEWRALGSVAEAAAFLKLDECYLRHEHPVHAYLHQLTRVRTQDAVTFLDAEVLPWRGTGLDVIAVPSDFSCAIICNHDGGIFLCLPVGFQ